MFCITIPWQFKVANNTVILWPILCCIFHYYFSLNTQVITICSHNKKMSLNCKVRLPLIEKFHLQLQQTPPQRPAALQHPLQPVSTSCSYSSLVITDFLYLMKRLLQHSAGIPPNKFLLQERDRALLSGLIFHHRVQVALRSVCTTSPTDGGATLHLQALSQGWFPKFWH